MTSNGASGLSQLQPQASPSTTTVAQPEWSVQQIEAFLQNTIALGSEKFKPPDGHIVVVLASTFASVGNGKLDVSRVWISTANTAKSRFLGVGTGSKVAKVTFMSPDVVVSSKGSVLLRDNSDKNGETWFAVGKEDGEAYIKVGTKPVRLFMAFEIERPTESAFTLHLGNLSIPGIVPLDGH
jgi:hypothetical protein